MKTPTMRLLNPITMKKISRFNVAAPAAFGRPRWLSFTLRWADVNGSGQVNLSHWTERV